jgi:hypothetical protein
MRASMIASSSRVARYRRAAWLAVPTRLAQPSADVVSLWPPAAGRAFLARLKAHPVSRTRPRPHLRLCRFVSHCAIVPCGGEAHGADDHCAFAGVRPTAPIDEPTRQACTRMPMTYGDETLRAMQGR